MKSFVLATAMCFAIAGGAAAQTADKQGEAGNVPTKSMDAVTPEMKGTGTGEHPPTQQMDKAVPEMKSGGSTTGMSTGTKLSQADCDAVWMKANPANAARPSVSRCGSSRHTMSPCATRRGGAVPKSPDAAT